MLDVLQHPRALQSPFKRDVSAQSVWSDTRDNAQSLPMRIADDYCGLTTLRPSILRVHKDIQGWTSTLMSNPTLWHAQFGRQLPSHNKLQRRQLATPLNAP
ncbi:MAG: hypothetical protein ACJAZO_003523 [Myxococcota bacterium]|jgi:hypothetical protein